MTETDNIETTIEVTVPLFMIPCPETVIAALCKEGVLESGAMNRKWTMGDLVKWLGEYTGADL